MTTLTYSIYNSSWKALMVSGKPGRIGAFRAIRVSTW